jgi:hypothetical protein
MEDMRPRRTERFLRHWWLTLLMLGMGSAAVLLESAILHDVAR